jgi:hypothetical protein
MEKPMKEHLHAGPAELHDGMSVLIEAGRRLNRSDVSDEAVVVTVRHGRRAGEEPVIIRVRDFRDMVRIGVAAAAAMFMFGAESTAKEEG